MIELEKAMEQINNSEIGAKFFKADLHIHTPASSDFIGSVTPEDIINKAIEKKLNIIAITDHNSVEWCERIIETSKGKNIDIFPGIEISTQGGKLGLHFIAIFDKDKPLQEIKDCLAKIGLDSKKQGTTETLTTESIEKIMKEIRESNGIVIGAHAYSPKGICNGMQGNQRTEIIKNKNLCAIEIADLKHIDFFKGLDPQYQRLLACIKSSDAHCLDDIGKEYTLLKMGDSNIEGLRQAFCDPQSRIRFDSAQIHNHPSIIGMIVEGGFLDGEIFHFNENMNTFIGAKGTGKSTAIELMRYVLCSEHKNKKLKEEHNEMIKEVLGNGTIILLIKTKDNQNYLISRRINEETKIYRDDGVLLDISIQNFFEFFDIECYSQGELISISKDSTNQLKMIDRYIDFENLIENERNHTTKLSTNASSILRNIERIEELRIKTERLPSVLEKIRIIEEKGLKTHSETQKKWEYEKTVIKNIIDKITKKMEEINKTTLFNLDDFEVDIEKLVNVTELGEFHSNYLTLKSSLEIVHRESIIQKIKEHLDIVLILKKKWETDYQTQLEEFKKITEDLKSKDIDISNYLKLEEEKNDLESNAIEIGKLESNNQELFRERDGLLKELILIRNKISDKRKKEIDAINEKLKDVLRINLDRESFRNDYFDWMIDCLHGSRFLKEDTKKLCDTLKPMELYNIIENKKEDCVDILSSKTELTKNYFERLMKCQSFINKLFDLQLIKLEDTLDIKLNDNGWKSLPSLSVGGKCTAILLIAMLERRIPLLIDQPEDSLDNSFIYTSIVQIIRKLKDKRQLIVVTHNANIPVLGDCEQMFVMNSNGLKGDVRQCGVIDDEEIKKTVQNILEGGTEAFRKRQEKYGI